MITIGAAVRALERGEPRRCRAILRRLRTHGRVVEPAYTYYEAQALFWEGRFADALDRARLLEVHGLACIALTIDALIFEERHDEARAVLEAHRTELDYATAKRLEVTLRFHEGEDVAEWFARALTDAPMSTRDLRIVRLYAAAIAHRHARESDARAYLTPLLTGEPTLFTTAWAENAWVAYFSEPPPARRRRTRPFALEVLGDLAHGAQSLLLRPSASRRPPRTFTRVAALAAIDVAIVVGLRALVPHTSEAWFFYQGAIMLVAPLVALGVVGALVPSIVGARAAAIRVCGQIYAALPFFLVFDFVARIVAARGVPTSITIVTLAIVGLLALSVCAFALRRAAPRFGMMKIIPSVVVICAAFVFPWREVRATELWVEPMLGKMHAPDYVSDEIDVGAFFFEQADRVHALEATLAPQRKGVADLYFVGVGGYDQNVFTHEITFAQSTLDRRFDTKGHSLLLSNSPSTYATLPMATPIALHHVLMTIGAQMDRDEDVLFLFLTSHGSKTGLALRAERFPFAVRDPEITPAALEADLDTAGIKWRIIVVSGCMSGVFMSTLQNDHALVATAAAGDRYSYGCAPQNEFTSYGRALFAEQLSRQCSIVSAFAKATEVVGNRELDRGDTPSAPQLSIGDAMSGKLHDLEARDACSDAK